MLSEYLMSFTGIRYRDCQIVTETRFYVTESHRGTTAVRRDNLLLAAI